MKRLAILIISGLCLTINPASYAQTTDQQPHAALLEVTSSGVTVLRQNTQARIPVRAGAVMPVGTGDRIQTSETGRSFVRFDNAHTMLILPATEVYIHNYAIDAQGQLDIHVEVRGVTVQHTAQMNSIRQYTLEVAEEFRITSPAEAFAVWLNTDATAAATVAAGELTLSHREATFTVSEGEGYSTQYAAVTPITGQLPNVAGIITQVEGCTAQVSTTEERNLTIRNAPTIETHIVGFVPNNTAIQVVGVSADGQRLRVRYYNDFGWVEALGVVGLCDDLPIYPLTFREFYRQMVNITEDEYALTLPYWGRTTEDLFFYRFVEENPPNGE